VATPEDLRRHGFSTKPKFRVLIAEWIWNIGDEHFPDEVQIVYLYHARQHLWDLDRKLHPRDEAQQKRWLMAQQDKLDNGKIERLVSLLRGLALSSAELADRVRQEADYFEKNAERVRYREFRRPHLFVGSGVIEAGCNTVIGAQLKRSGMFWSLRGANAVVALCCCWLRGQFEDYWEVRRA
jgi:hypothetical protein